MKKSVIHTSVIFICCVAMISACKDKGKDCPTYFKIHNATNTFVDLKFYSTNKVTGDPATYITVVDSINIGFNGYYINEGPDNNDFGAPAFYAKTDSLLMIFDGTKTLMYYQNDSPSLKNVLNVFDYSPSKSDNECNKDNEVMFHITDDIKALAR
jgi:hypothetical protein